MDIPNVSVGQHDSTQEREDFRMSIIMNGGGVSGCPNPETIQSLHIAMCCIITKPFFGLVHLPSITFSKCLMDREMEATKKTHKDDIPRCQHTQYTSS